VFLKIRDQALQLSPIQLVLLTIWALVMVSLPIADWSTGWSGMVGAITAGVSLTAALVCVLLWEAWGVVRALRVTVTILTVSWAAEVIGSRTGFPFGAYSYMDMLEPQILDIPLQVPLGWLMMLPPAWAAAAVLTQHVKPDWKFPTFVGLSALAMTAWDLFLDPMMVAWGVWAWEHPGIYFGIPGTNYLGWALISALITILVRPDELPLLPLLLVYTTMWLLTSAGLGFFWGIPGAAAAGCFVMGSLTILAWRACTSPD
jgi:putative membrane protein